MSKNDGTLLSGREEEVLLLSASGLTDKEIAQRLGLGVATINTYWKRMREKLGGVNRAELVAAVLRRNADDILTAKELENFNLISEVVRRTVAEREVSESKRRLQAIIDGTPVIIFVKDMQGRYLLVNKQLEALVKRDRRQMLGRRDSELFEPNIAAQFRSTDQAVMESGEPSETEETYTDEAGTRCYLTLKFPLTDSDGTMYGVCGFARDVTTRKELELKIQRSERRLQALVENCNDMITLVSEDGTILYTTPSTERVLGHRADDWVGRSVFEYVSPNGLEKLRSHFERLRTEKGLTIADDLELVISQGGYMNLNGSATNLLDDEAVGAIVLNYRAAPHPNGSKIP